MTLLRKVPGERVAFAVIAVLFLSSFGWAWLMRAEARRVRANPVAVHFAKSAYLPVEWPIAVGEPAVWTKPAMQSAGAGWVYDLFTPPVVFYHPATGRFAVTPPLDPGKAVPAFPVELISVRRELYQLQLSGYFGETGSYTAVFMQPGKIGTFFVREGGHVDVPPVTLRKFFLRRPLPNVDHAAPLFEPVAFAELYDERTKATVTLNTIEPSFNDSPIAIVRVGLPDAAPREVHIGDTVTVGQFIYRMIRISYVPAELIVTRETLDAAVSETRVLRPVGVDSAAVAMHVAEPSSLSLRPATGFITPEK